MKRAVKICGVRTLEAAAAVREAGADFAGLNFVPASKRCIPDLATARRILDALGPEVRAAGVFMDQSAEAIEAVLDALALTFVQLHGSEPPELSARLARRTQIIKAAPAARLETLEAHAQHAALFLVDGPRPGAGLAFDWPRLRSVRLAKPYLIAGGLTPENVAEAIDATDAIGVDTASGIEIAGAASPERIHAFVRAVRETR